MAVQLIRNEERLKYNYQGSTFYYRRLSGTVRARLLNKHTKNGVLDAGNYVLSVLTWCIIGWDNVDGSEVAFDPDLIPHLPDEATERLSDLVSEAVVAEQERTGN